MDTAVEVTVATATVVTFNLIMHLSTSAIPNNKTVKIFLWLD